LSQKRWIKHKSNHTG